MKLLPGDIVLIHRGTGWMIFAPLVWLWQWAVGPYHVEMVWDVNPFLYADAYKAFTLQPPVLDIVWRKLTDLKIKVYRLKDRPNNMTEEFWMWGNNRLVAAHPYVLGWQTCGHPVQQFYQDIGTPCTNSHYPGAVEKFCKRSEKFVEVL